LLQSFLKSQKIHSYNQQKGREIISNKKKNLEQTIDVLEAKNEFEMKDSMKSIWEEDIN
jgi:hypothetical protein